MKKSIQDSLIEVIRETLRDLKLFDHLKEDLYLDFPTDSRFGDFFTNIALKLSKELKKSPRDIAAAIIESVKQNLTKSDLNYYVSQIKAEGAGFINFYLADKYFYEKLQELVTKGPDSLRLNKGAGKPVLIEFVSANPTGSLSVAHARQGAVGDCLANVLGFLGFKVKREYYLNDEGNQINILGESVELRIRELNGEQIEFPEEYYQGDYIYDIAKEAKKNKIKTGQLGDFAASYILKIIKKELDDFGIKFDIWYSQKELGKSGKIEKGLEALKKKDYLYEQEGALWFKSTVFGDDKDRVVRKSDGAYTYLAPDIAYHQEKYRRGFEWLINLWGPDHHGYIGRIKSAISAFGHNPETLSIIIVQLATIFKQGKPVLMSTRKGQYITLREVLDEVGKDASRFFFLMRRTSSHLDFDLDAAKKQTSENPIFYVQYAHARICSIIHSNTLSLKEATDLSVLKEKEELALIKKALQFSSILNICYSTLDPYMLTVYLQELSETFHKFYDLHRVLGEDSVLTQARLCLIRGVKIALATGLDLLGVSKPEKM
ncbi:MAG: arginine--tRNA ligase [Candidatus Omnitrophota bacterium]